MESIPISALTFTILFLVFAMCFSLILVVIEDNRLDPLDSFLINEVQLHGALTPEVLNKFNTATAVMNLDANNFDFSGSTTTPVERGENAIIKYIYRVQSSQKPLEVGKVPKIETVEKEFHVKRTGR